MDPALATDPIDPALATDPIDPALATDPMDPALATDPMDPALATDPVEPALAIEPTDRSRRPETRPWTLPTARSAPSSLMGPDPGTVAAPCPRYGSGRSGVDRRDAPGRLAVGSAQAGVPPGSRDRCAATNR